MAFAALADSRAEESLIDLLFDAPAARAGPGHACAGACGARELHGHAVRARRRPGLDRARGPGDGARHPARGRRRAAAAADARGSRQSRAAGGDRGARRRQGARRRGHAARAPDRAGLHGPRGGRPGAWRTEGRRLVAALRAAYKAASADDQPTRRAPRSSPRSHRIDPAAARPLLEAALADQRLGGARAGRGPAEGRRHQRRRRRAHAAGHGRARPVDDRRVAGAGGAGVFASRLHRDREGRHRDRAGRARCAAHGPQLHRRWRGRASSTAWRFTASCTTSWCRAAIRAATAKAAPATRSATRSTSGPICAAPSGMALDWRDTGGSQFFITHSPAPHLDARYTVFGFVVNGMEVVDRIVPWDVSCACASATASTRVSESAVQEKGAPKRPVKAKKWGASTSTP